MGRPCFPCVRRARISEAISQRYSVLSCYSSVRQIRYEPKPVALKARRLVSTVSKGSRLRSDPYFRESVEVLDAIMTNKPVVALETTIYTHGFPYPDNVALALELEDIVRSNGGVPATIGILDGIARIGLSREELVALTSTAGKPETMKVSRRDLPYIIGMVSRYFAFRPLPVYVLSKALSSAIGGLGPDSITKVESRVSLDVRSMAVLLSLELCSLHKRQELRCLGLGV